MSGDIHMQTLWTKPDIRVRSYPLLRDTRKKHHGGIHRDAIWSIATTNAMVKSPRLPTGFVPSQPMTETLFALHANEQLLSVQQVADALSVSRLTIYRLIERRLLPAFRVARRLRFSRADVRTYLARVKTPSL